MSDLEGKIDKLLKQLQEIEEQLGNPEVYSDQKQYRQLSQRHAYLNDVKAAWGKLIGAQQQLADNQELLSLEKDPECIALLEEDILKLKDNIPKLESKLMSLVVPPDPNDSRTLLMEFRAGTGGEEAALFVADCVRMYQLFADKMKWGYVLISATPSDQGGFKEYIMELSGHNVYRFLQYEAGTHRVQRVPETEAQGRVHTSAITIAVLLEPDEEEDIQLAEKDLRIETFRASGAGGQHVNVTDSAVRITHIPTGVVAACQQERSQIQNREKAMQLIKARIMEKERERKQQELYQTRQAQVGSGDRSERIRTYNFPQNRVTDHRIGLTLYSLDRVMHGDLEAIPEALVAHYAAKKLEEV